MRRLCWMLDNLVNLRALLGILLLTFFGFGGHLAGATTLVVPDDVATVQAALDTVTHFPPALIDTILLRPQIPPESLTTYTSWSGVLIGLADSATTSPTLSGMTFSDIEPGMTFQNVHFSGTFNTTGRAFALFRNCRLDAGLNSAPSDPVDLRFNGCTITGAVSTSVNSDILADSCTFLDGSIQFNSDQALIVRNSQFVTHGGGAAISAPNTNYCIVDNNTIRNFDVGVIFAAQGAVSVTNNRIEACVIGISADATDSPATVTSNVLTSCGTGISAGGELELTDNVVLHSVGDGIYGLLDGGETARNVVGWSGRHGFYVSSRSDGGYGFIAHHNTSFSNGASGFAVDASVVLYGAVPSHLSNNIAYLNHGFGLLSLASDAPVLSCNDWFANDSSNVSGVNPSPDDLSVDPRFCDVANDDVHLAANSPLLDYPGCGVIGALGQGCDAPTPTLVSLFVAERESDGVRIRWQLSDPVQFDEVWIERAEVTTGPWRRIATDRSSDGSAAVDIDRSVVAERSYWYRLVARAHGSSGIIGQPIEAAPFGLRAFALGPISPNPARGLARVAFDVAREGWIDISVLDVQGRSVAVLARGAWPAGRHAIEWPSIGSPNASGVFFVRYRFPGGEAVKRVIRMP